MKINKYFSIKFSVVLGIVASSCSNNNDQIVNDYSGEEKGRTNEQKRKKRKRLRIYEQERRRERLERRTSNEGYKNE